MPDPTAAILEHQQRIETFAETLLGTYLERLRTDDRVPRPKEFNDPIWGTIRLKSEEVVILDSPLLQRLRRIRQLGVVHLVYPAATHTRLEHSLGVLHQVQAMIDSLNQGRVNTEQGPVVGTKLELSLRIGALCHDIGHGAMSHVSEFALDDNLVCDDLRLDFQELHQLSHKSQLSEIAAYFLIGSPAFRDLTKQALALAGVPPDPELCDRMQGLIISTSVDDRVVLAHELISGPFDADKLDYLARDAHMCGVPIVTDTTRLIQKLRAADVDRERLTEKLRQFVKDRTDGYIVTGLARSGGSTLDELSLARVLMFDKVYRHHKVRAAESMVFELVRRLATLRPDTHPALIPLLLSDDELLDMDAQRVADFANISNPTDEQKSTIEVVEQISSALRERRLLSRGFAIASTMTNDTYKGDAAQSAGLKRLLLLAKRDERADLEEAICTRIEEMASLTKQTDAIAPYAGNLCAFVHFSQPKPAPKTIGTDTGHAHLIDDDNTLTSVNDDAPETIGWTDAYVATRDLGHVFCPEEIRTLVYVATELELRLRYQIRMPVSMLPYAKQDREEVRQLKLKLQGLGYFAGLPIDLKPEPDVFLTAAFPGRVSKVLENLQGYSGPVRLRDGIITRSSTMSRGRIEAFLKQFETSDRIDQALKMLENLKVVGRDDFTSALAAFLAAHPEFEGASLCSLGAPKDSSALIENLAVDQNYELPVHLKSLNEALAENKPVIFMDDFVGTGKQASNIVRSWMGLAGHDDLGEMREALGELQQKQLKECESAFVFVAGLEPDSASSLTSALSELGLDTVVFANLEPDQLPTLNSTVGDSAFEAHCKEVGERIHQNSDEEQRTADWIAERVLGYGNRGLLVSSPFNTPTAALTLLWGGDDPTVWEPLLPRRKKY